MLSAPLYSTLHISSFLHGSCIAAVFLFNERLQLSLYCPFCWCRARQEAFCGTLTCKLSTGFNGFTTYALEGENINKEEQEWASTPETTCRCFVHWFVTVSPLGFVGFLWRCIFLPLLDHYWLLSGPFKPNGLWENSDIVPVCDVKAEAGCELRHC